MTAIGKSNRIHLVVLEPQPANTLGIDPNTVVTVRDVLALLELRISLETEAAGLAAIRRSDAQLQQLRHALDSFQASVRGGAETVPSDLQFHLLGAGLGQPRRTIRRCTWTG